MNATLNPLQVSEPLALECAVQRYSWGRAGGSSLVNRLTGYAGAERGAELWVGAHPSAPAMVNLEGNRLPLDRFLSSAGDPVLGARAAARFGKNLPFLFKVLSIAAPLSIQVHPNREQAVELHAADPAHYPDPNPKPELAIAISELPMLHGMRGAAGLRAAIQHCPELKSVLGEELVSACFERQAAEAAVQKTVFEGLLLASPERLEAANKRLIERLTAKDPATLGAEESWILKTAPGQQADDPGLFCFLVLNLRILKPGEAIFTDAGIPHAYLGGELIECMTNSDNVVRAALTNKFCDRDALLRVTRFGLGETALLDARAVAAGQTAYEPPVKDFALDVINPAGNFTLDGDGAAQVLFSLTAAGQLEAGARIETIRPGSAFFMPASLAQYTLRLSAGGLYRTRIPL